MSEPAKEPAKKKGKLPIFIVLALVLGGGGFFAMKGKGGKKKEPPIKLGAIVPIEDEFLTNMAEKNCFVRAKISLQFKDKFEAKAMEENMGAVQDAINMKLQATSIQSVASLAGLRKLKEGLAIEINKIFLEAEKKKDEHAEEEEDTSKKKKKKKKHDEEDEEEPAEIPEGWDSAEGPVLKVLFISFATQAQ